jgi:hypothetical protein
MHDEQLRAYRAAADKPNMKINVQAANSTAM